METMNVSPEVIQAVISNEKNRQIVEQVIEEIGLESDYLEELSPKQIEVGVRMALSGKGSRSIAAEKSLSPRTIDSHLHELYRRSGVGNEREFLSAIIRKLLEGIYA